jgi:GTP cyclohydrolase II
VVIYLHQEGRGIGLAQKVRAYALQESGYDTLEANCALGLPEDARTYESAASILHDLGVRSVELITNNPDKIKSLICLGVDITGRIPVVIPANHFSAPYLETKFTRMRHIPAGTTSTFLARKTAAND